MFNEQVINAFLDELDCIQKEAGVGSLMRSAAGFAGKGLKGFGERLLKYEAGNPAVAGAATKAFKSPKSSIANTLAHPSKRTWLMSREQLARMPTSEWKQFAASHR